MAAADDKGLYGTALAVPFQNIARAALLPQIAKLSLKATS